VPLILMEPSVNVLVACVWGIVQVAFGLHVVFQFQSIQTRPRVGAEGRC
jgi:hypothetical protein